MTALPCLLTLACSPDLQTAGRALNRVEMKTPNSKSTTVKNNCNACQACKICPIWKTLISDSRYRGPQPAQVTRTIGDRIPDGVAFRYLPITNELEITLSRVGRTAVQGYPRRFSEFQFKPVCCRVSFVTAARKPSAFVGNTQFNRQANGKGWNNVPAKVFKNARVDPPYLAAVVRKILEDNPPLDHSAYCPNGSKCS